LGGNEVKRGGPQDRSCRVCLDIGRTCVFLCSEDAKYISGETIKTITFNEALDAGTSFGDALDQMLKLHLDPGKNNDANVNSYYANCEVILPEVTTTATATTTPSATPTPTPTPTTGDAMLAVVALAVVAMAGTAIVSKKRR